MKETFRFLREHRHALKLRVNAAEDLLLNGSREPTHRGVCQHLLAKVERSRVLAVSERLSPAEATRFLAGILRFSPEIPYTIRFLECVKASASQTEAGAALTHALRHLDFAEASPAQVRQILFLIVEVFPRQEMPVLFLSLLSGAPFRRAVDRSADVLPETLAAMVLPLRAVRSVLARDEQRSRDDTPGAGRYEPADVEHGALLLLQAATANLLELEGPARRRLFELGCAAVMGAGPAAEATVTRLRELLPSVPFSNDAERARGVEQLVSAALTLGLEAQARTLLDETLRKHPQAAPFSHWRKLLDAPRVGHIAMDPPDRHRDRRHASATENGALPPPGRWYRGFHVPTQTTVRLRYGEASEAEHYRQIVALWRNLLVPAVERLVESGDGERPYLALRSAGRSLARALEDPRGLDAGTRRAWCLEVCQILSAVGRSGVELPDADPHRFSVDPALRLWLVDPWLAAKSAPDAAERAHLSHAVALCKIIAIGGRTPAVSAAVLDGLERAASLTELAAMLGT
jgi:hypothetical protein